MLELMKDFKVEFKKKIKIPAMPVTQSIRFLNKICLN